ncbi:hypothetical protein A2U01_0022030 [Trifolium medium]|uniref:Uncharacterized protein n=1 Tax=Trifolium medium TaxID=97028 RepID=A0A392NPK0_9FABA|nr:hypothetical protein [Trifolium medium]
MSVGICLVVEVDGKAVLIVELLRLGWVSNIVGDGGGRLDMGTSSISLGKIALLVEEGNRKW